jgi:hypothetical protein
MPHPTSLSHISCSLCRHWTHGEPVLKVTADIAQRIACCEESNSIARQSYVHNACFHKHEAQTHPIVKFVPLEELPSESLEGDTLTLPRRASSSISNLVSNLAKSLSQVHIAFLSWFWKLHLQLAIVQRFFRVWLFDFSLDFVFLDRLTSVCFWRTSFIVDPVKR